MGKFNSSLTRVQPIFEALYETDPSGGSWVKSLLDIATRNDSLNSAATEINLGHFLKPPQFKFPVDPPKSYLKWLIEHPEELSSPPATAWRIWDERTQAIRSRFLLGDKEVQSEAISNIERCKSLPKIAWWRLEGVTYVDCALFTDSTAIFIEGKRTEIGPSKEVLWYHQRNQIHRNLDCAAAYAQKKRLQHYFVIAIVDKDPMERDPIRQKEYDALMSPDVICRSLPHLNDGELKEITRHYAGVTTWEDIIERFALGSKILPSLD